MEVSFEVHKISKLAIHNTSFLNSVGGVDELLVRLLLIKQIVNSAKSVCISFSIKHPQTFRES